MHPQKRNPAADDGGAREKFEKCPAANPSDLQNSLVQRRWQRPIEHLHHLGARAVSEFLLELAREHGLGDEIARKLESYAALDPDIVRALRGDRFPPAPLRIVGGDR